MNVIDKLFRWFTPILILFQPIHSLRLIRLGGNQTPTIKSDLPKDGNTELIVYDILGRRIKQLVNEYRTAGSYEQIFDGSNLASGIYVYRLKAGDFIATKKMLMIK